MIGNLLEFEGKICTVKEIDGQGCVFEFDDGETEWIDLFQMSPIAITEYWLDKICFENRRFHNYVIKKQDIHYFWSYISWPDKTHYLDEIKYVHQLQNLITINAKKYAKEWNQ